MMTLRNLSVTAAMLFAICPLHLLIANDSTDSTAPMEQTIGENATTSLWSYTVSAYAYFVPDDQNYVSAIFTADKNWLHIEARYNYEDIRTGSAWIGYNFSAGTKLVLDVTPMFAGVFGNTNGVAPGWEVSLSYARVEFYSENEYVFDLQDSAGNFYYNWTELTFSPVDWFQAGLIVQRTKTYQTDLDVQRGLVAGFSYKAVNLTAYVFNLGWETPTVAVSVGINF